MEEKRHAAPKSSPSSFKFINSNRLYKEHLAFSG